VIIMHYHLPLHRRTQVVVLVAAHLLAMPTVLTVELFRSLFDSRVLRTNIDSSSWRRVGTDSKSKCSPNLIQSTP